MRPRTTIAGLASAIVFCGVAFASLRSPIQLWAGTIFLARLGSLPIALINVLYNRGRRRAFWAGFLLCGGTYFAAALSPWLREDFGPRMATIALLDLIYPRVSPHREPPAGQTLTLKQTYRRVAAFEAFLSAGGPANPVPVRFIAAEAPTSRWAAWTEPDRTDSVGYQIGTISLVSTSPFRRIGQSLLTIVFAYLGGVYARNRHDRPGGREFPSRTIERLTCESATPSAASWPWSRSPASASPPSATPTRPSRASPSR